MAETDQKKRYSLEQLVAEITEENRHEEIDTGTAVGNEFPQESHRPPSMNGN